MKEILHHKTLDYVINYPDDYEEGKKFPLLIHLHGAGTRGNDISLVADTAVGPLGEINRGVRRRSSSRRRSARGRPGLSTVRRCSR